MTAPAAGPLGSSAVCSLSRSTIHGSVRDASHDTKKPSFSCSCVQLTRCGGRAKPPSRAEGTPEGEGASGPYSSIGIMHAHVWCKQRNLTSSGWSDAYAADDDDVDDALRPWRRSARRRSMAADTRRY